MPDKFYIFKYEGVWLVVNIPAALIVDRCRSWADALEVAAHHLRAAIAPEVCS